MTRTALYRHFDGGGMLLYVGISLNTVARTQQHRAGAKWFDQIARIEIEWYQTRVEAEDAEKAAIQAEAPLHNITHARARQVDRFMQIHNPPWATNDVRVRGDKLGTELWRGKQWSVTEHGVEARDGTYFICRSRMFEGVKQDHPWESHMRDKKWVDIADFGAAMRLGRAIFPLGTRRAHIPCEAEE